MSLLKSKNGQLNFLENLFTEDQLANDSEYEQVMPEIQNQKERKCLGHGCDRNFLSNDYRFCDRCRRRGKVGLHSEIYEVSY